MSQESQRIYDKEFKLNAIKLYQSSQRSYQEIANELGIPTATLSGWVADQKRDGSQAFPGKGHLKTEDIEIAQLRKELAIVREERDILKKALGIFSSRQK